MSTLTPHDALMTAVTMFTSQAEFRRALQTASGRHITDSMVSVWKRRGNGAPEYVCPDIEALTGIPCEVLQPDVHWHVVANRWMRATVIHAQAVGAVPAATAVAPAPPPQKEAARPLLRRRPNAKLRQSKKLAVGNSDVHAASIRA